MKSKLERSRQSARECRARKKLGYQYLRPIQVAYESNKFMLPIRLGTLNAKGKQELFVYALTRTGRALFSRRAAHTSPNSNAPSHHACRVPRMLP